MAILKLVIAFILSLSQFFSPIVALISNGGEKAFFDKWSAQDDFNANSYIELEKTPGEDFVVLNLADIQLGESKLFAPAGENSKALIDKMVADMQPDLITLSGDNAWGTTAYIKLVEWIDSYGIPWAPVMGNHDGEDCPSEFWAAYLFYEAENCLFEFGPEDMGYGNYIINITENGRIVHTLFMMDTHSSASFTLPDGTVIEDSYDHLWPNQLEWYKWGVQGTKKLAGHTVESTVIMHIPVLEYRTAWAEAWDEEKGEFRPLYAFTSYGSNNEWICSSEVNNGFFDLCKDLGSTKNIIVGHDHANDSSILYKGIRLSYSVKTGFGSYWEADKIGGTTVTINSFGNAKVQNHYYDLEELGFEF